MDNHTSENQVLLFIISGFGLYCRSALGLQNEVLLFRIVLDAFDFVPNDLIDCHTNAFAVVRDNAHSIREVPFLPLKRLYREQWEIEVIRKR